MRVGYGRVSTRDQHPMLKPTHFTPPVATRFSSTGPPARSRASRSWRKRYWRANRTGDQLVVTKLDRLGRSLEHLIELSKQLQAKQVDLVVLDQGIDTSTAIGRMFFLAFALGGFFAGLLHRDAHGGGRKRSGPRA